ncbi:uncharacterized protein [Ptychodera flava]|uniref:uncharacterized protein n=1 Tax=Ptychodera flava TaxID=63121 RepID=UPI00396A70BB
MGKWYCAAALCNNQANKCQELSRHTFPTDEKRRKVWIALMRRADNFAVTQNTRLCSAHFKTSDFQIGLAGKRYLKPGILPSIFPWTKSTATRPLLSRRCLCLVDDNVRLPVTMTSASISPQPNSAVLGPLTLEECLANKVQQLEKENQQLKKENLQRQQQLDISQFGLNRFSCSDDDIYFYTSFQNYRTLIGCYEYLKPRAEHLHYWQYAQRRARESSYTLNPNSDARKTGRPRSLQPIDEFFLLLCHLRLGLFERDLAHRFSVSISIVSDICITWIYNNFMYLQLGSLPIWPLRQKVNEHMPEIFKSSYPDTRCIIDCPEIKCETPSDYGTVV